MSLTVLLLNIQHATQRKPAASTTANESEISNLGVSHWVREGPHQCCRSKPLPDQMPPHQHYMHSEEAEWIFENLPLESKIGSAFHDLCLCQNRSSSKIVKLNRLRTSRHLYNEASHLPYNRRLFSFDTGESFEVFARCLAKSQRQSLSVRKFALHMTPGWSGNKGVLEHTWHAAIGCLTEKVKKFVRMSVDWDHTCCWNDDFPFHQVPETFAVTNLMTDEERIIASLLMFCKSPFRSNDPCYQRFVLQFQ